MKVNFYLDKCNLIAEVNHQNKIKRKRFGLNVQVESEHWDAKNKKVKNGKHIPYSLSTNNVLLKFEGCIKNYYNNCIDNDNPISSETLSDYLNKHFFNYSSYKDKKSLIDIFAKYIENLNLSKSTIASYKSALTLLNAYKAYYKINVINIDNIDASFFENLKNFFYNYYESIRSNKNENSFSVYASKIKKVLNYCIENGITNNMQYSKFKAKTHVSDKKIPTLEELEIVKNLQLDSTCLSVCRDLYILYTHVSLRYCDLMRFDKDKHLIFENGKYYINIVPDKTVKFRKKTTIPLRKEALEIFQKYNFVVPRVENYLLNIRIKEIFEIAGITYEILCIENHKGKNIEVMRRKCDTIKVHSSRAFFITDLLSNGISSDDTCSMVGIDQKTLKHYNKVTSKQTAERLASNPIFD